MQTLATATLKGIPHIMNNKGVSINPTLTWLITQSQLTLWHLDVLSSMTKSTRLSSLRKISTREIRQSMHLLKRTLVWRTSLGFQNRYMPSWLPITIFWNHLCLNHMLHVRKFSMNLWLQLSTCNSLNKKSILLIRHHLIY